MRRLFVSLLVIVILVIAGGIGWIYFQGEAALRAAAEEQGPKVFGSKVELGRVGLSVLGGKASLEKLAIWNPEGYSDARALQFDAVKIDLKPRSLLSDLIEIREIRIENPLLRVEPGKTNINLKALQDNVAKFTGPAPEEQPAEAKPAQVAIQDFHLNGAKVVVGGGAIGFSDQTLSIADIHLTDIGGPGGTTPAKAAELVMNALLPQVQKALASGAGRQLLSNAREQLANVEGRARQAVEGVKGEVEGKLEDAKSAVEEKAGDLSGSIEGQAGDAAKKAEERLKKGVGGLLGGSQDTEKSDSEDGGGGL